MEETGQKHTKVTGTLEDWLCTPVTKKEYVIWGAVEGDTEGRFHNGTRIHTSGIREDKYPRASLKEGSIVHTRNSIYILGNKLELIDN